MKLHQNLTEFTLGSLLSQKKNSEQSDNILTPKKIPEALKSSIFYRFFGENI